jgi:ATP-binding cassette subfamily B protein
LVKLLCRFYVPQEGSIEIDGIDIAKFDPQELRRNLSAQFQFPANYHETAGQNIAFGDVGRVARPEEIESAARAAGAHDFVSKLPKGYDTMLGRHFADGWELSGGQWQRLTLARAYFRDAPILILDEPTSFMDSWSEAEWFDHLRELLTGRTGLVITHRFTIAMRADIIMVVDNGKIIESGTHNELLTGDGFYAQSWKSQMEASKDGKPAAANQ